MKPRLLFWASALITFLAIGWALDWLQWRSVPISQWKGPQPSEPQPAQAK